MITTVQEQSLHSFLMLRLHSIIVDFNLRKRRLRYLVYKGQQLLLWISIWNANLLKETWVQLEVVELD